jgi:hypothetical protein
VWENPDPDFTFPLEGTVDGDPASFDLAVGHPSAVEGLQTEVTEGDGGSALGITSSASAVAFAELGSFGHQRHNSVLLGKVLFGN